MKIGCVGIGYMGHGMAKNILEKGYSIPVLMQKMVVDRLGDDGGAVDFLNFVPITDENDEVVVI